MGSLPPQSKGLNEYPVKTKSDQRRVHSLDITAILGLPNGYHSLNILFVKAKSVLFLTRFHTPC
jgi:hypothetical protein